MAKPQPVLSADLLNGAGPARDARMRFRVLRSGTVNGVGLWFRAMLTDGVQLASDPAGRLSSWPQGFLPVPRPFDVRHGDELEVSVAMRPTDERGGCFDIAVEVWGE